MQLFDWIGAPAAVDCLHRVGNCCPPTDKEAAMISRFIDRWFDELIAWEPGIDVLANLPDNF